LAQAQPAPRDGGSACTPAPAAIPLHLPPTRRAEEPIGNVATLTGSAS